MIQTTFHGIVFSFLALLVVACSGSNEDKSMAITASQNTPMVSSSTGNPPRSEQNSIIQPNLEPGVYTLEFGFNGMEAGFNPSANAIINWNTRGQQQRRVISIVSGASISGPCDGVSVKVQDTGDIFGISVNGKSYNIQATLTPGVRPNTQQPPVLVTTPIFTLAHGAGTGLIAVPEDSGVISVYVLAPTAAPGDILVEMESGGTTLAQFHSFVNDDWVPLVPGTSNLIITNNTAGTTIPVSLIWGIDG